MELQKTRKQIDEIDRQLLTLFVQRLELMDAVLDYKVAHKLPVFDPVREAERLRTAAAFGGTEYGAQTRQLMELVIASCRDYQQHRLQTNAGDRPFGTKG